MHSLKYHRHRFAPELFLARFVSFLTMETIDSSPSFQLVSTADLGGVPEKPGQVKIRLTIALAVPAGE